MTVTRQPLVKCRTKGCPFTPDEHDEWMALCRQAPEHGHRDDQLSHQHLPKKGMGGHNSKSKIVSILCWPMHDRIDNGDWGNDVKDIPGKGKIYFAWDIHGNTLIERPVGSAGAEAVKSGSIIRSGRGDEGEADPTLPRGSEGTIKPDSVAAHTLASAPPAGEKEEDDGEDAGARIREGLPEGKARRDTPAESRADIRVGPDSGDGDRTVDGGSRHSPVPLTHERRVAIAKEIHDTEYHRQWRAGDTANQWVAELGEEAEQYLSDFGYVHESLANIMRVCEAIPPTFRHGYLRFSHHVVVASLHREDMEMWLDTCGLESWSVAEFRRQVHGVKPKTKRWAVQEIRDIAPQWGNYTGGPSMIENTLVAFLAWLGEQEAK